MSASWRPVRGGKTDLRKTLESHRRALALARLRVAAAEGAYDLELLEDKTNYRR